jgi:hypothetical protein
MLQQRKLTWIKPEFGSQFVRQFSQQRAGREEFAGRQPAFDNIHAETFRHEAGNDHVRINNNPHEMSLKTSSSV